MRVLIYLLLASNILFGLWHVLRPTSENSVVDVGQLDAGQRLVLLDEFRVAVNVGVTEVADDHQVLSQSNQLSELPEPPGECARIGFFANPPDLTQFISGFESGLQYRVEIENVPTPPLHRVFLPSQGDRNDAQALLVSVREVIAEIGANIDTYLVVGGEFDNVVSLGMFSERNNALNVQRILSENSFDPQIAVENRLRQQIWLYVEWYEDSDFAKETRERALNSGLSLSVSQILCEMIAQQD